jgi:hypothetical protein
MGHLGIVVLIFDMTYCCVYWPISVIIYVKLPTVDASNPPAP